MRNLILIINFILNCIAFEVKCQDTYGFSFKLVEKKDYNELVIFYKNQNSQPVLKHGVFYSKVFKNKIINNCNDSIINFSEYPCSTFDKNLIVDDEKPDYQEIKPKRKQKIKFKYRFNDNKNYYYIDKVYSLDKSKGLKIIVNLTKSKHNHIVFRTEEIILKK